MRDPKRIEKVLNKFRELWYKYPDQRFFQLCLNVLNQYCEDTKLDPFFLEDNDVIKVIDNINKKWSSH